MHRSLYLQITWFYQKLRRINPQVEEDINSTVASLINYRQQSNILSYGLLDNSGINVFDTDPKNVGLHESDEEYFQIPFNSGQNYVSNVEFTRTSGKSGYITFSSPIKDATNVIIGVIRLRYSTSVFQHLLITKIGLSGKHSYPILIDNNLIRLTDTYNTNWNYTSIVPLAKDKVADLQLQGNIPLAAPYQASY